MDMESGTIVVAVISTLILAFALWLIKKLTEM